MLELIERNRITNYVKTFDDVCHFLNIDINKFNENLNILPKSQIAEIKLKLIIKVFNGDWIKDWSNHDEYYYVPYFDMNGGTFSYDSFYYWGTGSSVGLGWGFKNLELLEYCVKQFIDLYKDYFMNDDIDKIINQYKKY